MARLPTVASVPQVNPQSMRSPAIAGPRVQPSGLETIGHAVSEVNDSLLKAEERVRSREDTLARVKADGAFARTVEDEVARIQTEDDLTDPKALTRFGQFLNHARDQALQSHAGSEDSRARLEATLEGRINEARSIVAAKSVAAQRNAIQTQFGQDLNSMTASVVENPSRLEEMFHRLDGRIDDLAPGLTPEEELKYRNQGRQEIALSAVQSLVDRGDTDSARSILADVPGAKSLLSPEQSRRLETRISAVEQARTRAVREAEQKVAAAEIIKGGPLTTAQRVHLAGLDTPTRPQTFGDKVAEVSTALKRPLTQAEVAKMAGLDAFEPQTDAGKLVNDRQHFVDQYGANSEQVKAFDEASQSSNYKLSDVASMRKDYTMDSKQFVASRDSFARITSAAATPTPAGDLAIIYNFAKVLDPGAIVRQDDFEQIASAGGYGERIKRLMQVYTTGNGLTDTVRNDIVENTKRLFQAQVANQLRTEAEYQRIAKEANLPVTQVVIDYIGPYRDFKPGDGTGTPGEPTGTPTYDLNGNRLGGAPAAGEANPTAGPDNPGVTINSGTASPGGEDLSNLTDDEIRKRLGLSAPSPQEHVFQQSDVKQMDNAGAVTADARPFNPGESVDNGDGTHSTERSVTFKVGREWVNAPSLWMTPDGPVEIASEDSIADLVNAFEARTGEKFPRFRSMKEAEAAARARSNAGGAAHGSMAQ